MERGHRAKVHGSLEFLQKPLWNHSDFLPGWKGGIAGSAQKAPGTGEIPVSREDLIRGFIFFKKLLNRAT
jgi:hypothetical protein